MSNLFYINSPDRNGYLNSVRRTKAAGFNVIDFSMCPMQRRETELNEDDWEFTVDRIRNDAEKIGVEFSQAHLPYPKALTRRKTASDDGCEQNEYFVEMTNRALRICAMLGVKWAVVHPVTISPSGTDPEADIEYNRVIYSGYLELAEKLGFGLAFENMTDLDGKRRFGVCARELLALRPAFGNPENLGFCWDFGHANRVFADQSGELKKMLPYLRATHVDDNMGKDDLHLLPYLGTVNWNRLMPILRDGGYEGDFNYEIRLCNNLPDALKDEAAVFARHVGEHLLSLAK